MPVVDRREFGGRFGVKENSQRLANYRYLEVQLMEIIGGWSHTTPPINLKATFGYHVYDHAQAANLLGERLEVGVGGCGRQNPPAHAGLLTGLRARYRRKASLSSKAGRAPAATSR